MTTTAVQVSDRKALLSLLTCVSGVLAAVALVLAVSFLNGWPLVGKGVIYVLWTVCTVAMVFVNILDLVAVPGTVAIGLLFMLSRCLSAKGFGNYPGEGAAAWRVWLSENLGLSMPFMFLGFSLGLIALFSTIQGGEKSMVVYSGLVTMERERLAEQTPRVYWGWAKELGDKGEVLRHAFRSTCLALVKSTPASTPYTLTVNGRPAGPGSCGLGMNYMTWSSK